MARKALVVATDEYLDTGLRQLRSPGRDAVALTEVLGDPAIGAFTVTVLRNAGIQELREQLDAFFSTADRHDELLVHFSCHGLKDDGNDLYLAASDTRAAMLASTGLPADFVARRMRASRARSIALLLDCCYGGAFERGMLARAGSDVPVLHSFRQDHLAEGAGRVVITASSAVEYAFESGDLTEQGSAEPSVFTAAVVEGIASGEADTDGSGTISVHELFAYAERRVRQVNPRQTPHLWSFGTRGDIVVARSPLRRITPATLPASVQTALSGDRISRLGAVHVLSDLVDDADPAMALAAVQALQYLVGDDSRSLSEAARNTLHRIRLTAEPRVVEVVAGSAVRAEVVLGGSALSVAARVESSPEWIEVRQVGDHLHLTIDTADAAEAYIQAAGPTGSVDIRVTATARAMEPPPRPVRPAPGEAQLLELRLWMAAAALQLLVLFLPLDGEGYRLIGSGDSGADFWLWFVVLLGTAGLLATAGVRGRHPGPGGLVAGIAGLLLSAFFTVGAISVWVSDGAGAGSFVAVLATLLALAALVLMVHRRRTAPPGEPDRRAADQRDLRKPVS
ncbi:caspase domain-containing protein [Kribbella amoyensis]|uniref:Caspase domain-containing protein n=1 Tax=Kribbella amoyensis TaxID=996641 RepID=A0A561BQ57_9ACTN|nr:caspase family protein [Kribbella amoyensis]TWD80944.1 caspase domain-containing protein [Kribbella amoyensis]